MDSEERNRVFIATFFTEKRLIQLIKDLSLNSDDKIRFVPFEQIHITWKFIGNIETNKNKEIFNIINSHANILKDKTLILNKLEIWPNKRLPKLITLTASNYDEIFKDFFNNIEHSLYNKLKVEKEKRRFIPHITIARIKKDHRNIKHLFKKIEPIELKTQQIELVESKKIENKILYKTLFAKKL